VLGLRLPVPDPALPDRTQADALTPRLYGGSARGSSRPRAGSRQEDMEGDTMTTKADFSEEEWVRVVRAPFVAGMAITLADPGGPIEAAKESMASIKAATNPPSREQLLSEVALDIQA